MSRLPSRRTDRSPRPGGPAAGPRPASAQRRRAPRGDRGSAALLALVLAASGCAPARPPATRASRPALPEFPHLEERALLLLMADRKLLEPVAVATALEGDATLRAELASTLGRVGDARGRPELELLLADRVPEVRRAAAFALGRLGDPAARRALLRASRDPDLETGRLAVEALAVLETGRAEVEAALGGLPAETADRRLLPALFRFPADEALSRGLAGCALEEPEMRRWAAYALARNPLPGGAEALRRLLADADPWLRGWAARGLGGVGEGSDLALLEPLLGDAAGGPVIQALRAARALLADGRAAAPQAWRPRLLELLDDPRTGVRVTAVEAAGSWLLDDELGTALAARAAGRGREAELALLALAEGGDPRAIDLTRRAGASVETAERVTAARAALRLRDSALLERLFTDPSAAVRLDALAGLLEVDAENGARWAGRALEDEDAAMRAAALGWLVESPVVPAEALVRAIDDRALARLVDLGTSGARALAARGEREPLERGLVVRLLEDLARAQALPVRREAIAGLAALGRETPPLGAFDSRKTVGVYRELVRRTREPRYADLETARGTVRLRLDCPRAPLTCTNFLSLANQGFFDGLTFHRVVPDFVVQAGDPRGDGWGGPGYTIRDEPTRLRYRRGVVGMALSGPDTGGSQFFITLSPQPHLDATYAAFGEVAEGDEVLDSIVQGDRILRLVEVE